MAFGTIPWDWIDARRLPEFSPKKGDVGILAAALKAALAIGAYRNFTTGDTVLSCQDIVKITGASKPMVISGIALLDALKIIEIHGRAHRNTNVYRFRDFPGESNSFRKVPQDAICMGLPQLKARHPSVVDALRLYLAMIYLRENSTSKATVSHERLVHYTGVRPEDVARGNSLLVVSGLIQIRTAELTAFSRTGHPPNEYKLAGDFDGKRRQLPRPTAKPRDLF